MTKAFPIPVISAAALAAALAIPAMPATAQQKNLPNLGAPSPIGPKPPVGTGGCSATAPTCADVAPAIIRSALGPSPLAQDLRFLKQEAAGSLAAPAPRQSVVRWAAEAFRKAGVDWVRAEPYGIPAGEPPVPGAKIRVQRQAANVVAEIRGREKPAEYVILAARLDWRDSGTGTLDALSDAALVIDAARAIHAAGARPLRSIRFILFTGEGRGMTGPWAYVRLHRAEMNGVDAAIVYDAGPGRVAGYSLNGRQEIEPRLRAALAPAAKFGADHDTDTADMNAGILDFLLEGVPALAPVLSPVREPASDLRGRRAVAADADNGSLAALKRRVALAALTAYGVADLPERLAERQSRAEIAALLARTGLAARMKAQGLWEEWERGERGRRP